MSFDAIDGKENNDVVPRGLHNQRSWRDVVTRGREHGDHHWVPPLINSWTNQDDVADDLASAEWVLMLLWFVGNIS